MFPEEFLLRMKNILGDGFDAFVQSLTCPAVRSFRINRIKFGGELNLPEGVEVVGIPYCEGGFAVTSGGEGLGNSPEHHSGMIYFQDAGAMAPVSALPRLKDGAKVLDLCAAPGGKSGQLAQLIGHSGSLLSNEVIPKRARVLVSNMERLGITNACVTSLEVSEIASLYPAFFDCVVIDAPCSGEGMFRKGEAAVENWSVENILSSARRQKDILDQGSSCVAEGGYLLYSTCTYAPEENEHQVADFLENHPDFFLVECNNTALVAATAPGLNLNRTVVDTARARRSYPHLSLGEGQFLAVMKRRDGGGGAGAPTRDRSTPPDKASCATVNAFLRDNLTDIPPGRLVRSGSTVSLVCHEIPLPCHGVFMPGVAIGEVIKGRLVPHHQLFSAYGHLFKSTYELKDESEALKYMHGEELRCDAGLSGYVAVMWRGCALGGGKASGGVIKNHYPKGLRI